ncbi:MAG: leucine-rich repeat protein [Clostridia bacterium]|nr:leucine-rich repeat protein [Clostridia bacterium]
MKNFKKIMSLILAVVFVFVMSTVAFAAPGSGTPIGSAYEQEQFVLDAAYLSAAYSDEECFWDRDVYGLSYTDDEGNEWRHYNNKNWLYSNEDDRWLYKVLDDGTLFIVGNPDIEKNTEKDANIIVPSILEGKTVTKVMSAGNENTLSIIIPDTVTSIELWAFRNRQNLKRVVIPTSVKSIEVEAFSLTDDIELYYCGTEEQWNDIVVWNHPSTMDMDFWAVTNFNWLEKTHKGDKVDSFVKAVHFNVDPDTLEDLVPEEEQSIFEQIFAPIKTFFATVISFFKMIVSWFTFGQ